MNENFEKETHLVKKLPVFEEVFSQKIKDYNLNIFKQHNEKVNLEQLD